MSDLYLCRSCEEPFCGSCWEPCEHGEPICEDCSKDPKEGCWMCADEARSERDLNHLRGK